MGGKYCAFEKKSLIEAGQPEEEKVNHGYQHTAGDKTQGVGERHKERWPMDSRVE